MIMCNKVASVILILLTSFYSSACGKREESKNSPIIAESKERSVGSDAQLFLEGRNEIFVSVDEKAFNDLINTLSSGGGEVDSLIQSGKVFTVPNRTRVRILEIARTKNRVRIIEGERVMQEGWVHELWVR